MLKKILLSLCIFTSSAAFAEQESFLPCYDEMITLLMDFAEATENKMNIVVTLENQDESRSGVTSFKLTSTAPEELYSGVTVNFTMVLNDGICSLKE